MTHVTCKLTAKNRDQLRNPTLGNRVWATRHGTGSLGHRVNGLFGSSFTSVSPGHRVIILTRCETRVFPVFEKMPKMQNVYLKCGYKYSYLLTYLVEYSIRYSTEYSSSKKLDSHTPTHKSTFGVHYRTGSPGQLGLRVAGFPGHRVAGSQMYLCID